MKLRRLRAPERAARSGRRSYPGSAALGLLLTLLFAATNSHAEEVTLTLVSSWNARQNFTELFLDYVDAVNERGEGVVQIDFLGGPEVIPQRQLLYALRRGVVDMAFGAITYYRGVLPEGDAIFASGITPMEARSSGALEALQPYWAKRINARLVGWVQSGVGVNIYLTQQPRFGADNMPDLSGRIIRVSPSNREIVQRFGARSVQIAVKEIYTALQRGTVEGLAFTTTGMPDLGIDRFIKYRIDPAFLQLSICLQANLDVWNQLSPQARHILEDEAARYELSSRDDFFALEARELEIVRAQGMESVEIPGGAGDEYQRLVHEVVWDRMARRVPDAARELKPLFFPESRLPR